MTYTKRKFDQLDSFLRNLPIDDEPMLLGEFDGFLTGVIVCPEMIPPDKWMPHVWNESGDESRQPVFEDDDHANRILGLIMEHYNSVAMSLLPNDGIYEPLFIIDNNNEETIWELWAAGFGRALELCPKGWFQIVESGDPDAVEALAGLRTLVTIATTVPGDIAPPRADLDKLTKAAPELISEWVDVLSAWRLASNPIAPTSTLATFKNSGRNDPCPCGSGRKYKKCHGAN